MKHKTNLKLLRKQTGLLQSDLAYLLHIDTALYNRYEKGRREVTLDVILLFHILFGVSLKEMFSERYAQIKQRFLTRSTKLIEQLEIDQSPKRSSIRIAYLQSIVNTLTKKGYD